MNNVKQLAYAVTQHETKMQSLPGWRNRHPGTNGASVSWVVPLLSYMERNDIYRVLEQATSGGFPAATAVSIPLLKCPSSPSGSPTDPLVAYTANGGTSACNGTQQVRGDGVFMDTVGVPNVYEPARTNLDAINQADGTTNTLLFTERNSALVTLPSWQKDFAGAALPSTATAGLWYLRAATAGLLPDSGTSLSDVAVFGIAGGVVGANTKIINSATPPESSNPSYAAHPSSNHPGGVVAAMCDGRITFVKDSIARHVYAQLLSSDSRWQAGANVHPIGAAANGDGGYPANSARIESWLRSLGSAPYLLKESDL